MKRFIRQSFGRILSLALCLCLCATLVPLQALADSILSPGDTGDDVRSVQARLEELDWLEAGSYESGTYDEVTEMAVRLFQAHHGLLETGRVDRVTREVLFSDKAERNAAWVLEDLPGEYEESGLYEEYWAMPSMTAMPAIMSAAMPAMSVGAVPRTAAMYEKSAWNTEEYTFFQESGFHSVLSQPLSTFAADVDTSSYSQLRSRILRGETVPPQSVRIEEMLNYFQYDYPEPEGDAFFGVSMQVFPCPWNEKTKLLQIGLQAKRTTPEERKPHNLVFLIDTSGSMRGSDRLDLVKRAFQLLLETLAPEDTVSIVTYASQDRVVLEGAKAADRTRIMEAISELEAAGSTNGSAGILRSYEIAEKYFAKDGVNRILLATDGDLNVGVTSTGDLADLVTEQKKKGIALTVLGFGYGNLKDNKLEALADYGDGNAWYIDSLLEARKALVTEADGTFEIVAKDVKLQVDFNPAWIRGYRLIGYEDREMAAEDFANDSKDGGEVGSGHRVTVLYELVGADSDFDFGAVESAYLKPAQTDSPSVLTLSIRAKRPDAEESELFSYELTQEDMEKAPGEAADRNLLFAAGVAEVGMLLRDSAWKGTATYASALELLRASDVSGDVEKEEFVYLTGLLARETDLTGK